MRRALGPAVAMVLLLAGAGGLGACGSAGDARSTAVDLTIRLDRDGPGGPDPVRELRLRCDQPSESAACGAAAGVSLANVRPVPKGTACTAMTGGPQTARIVGSIRQDRIDAAFDRSNGCEINRWNKVADLLDQVR